MVERRDETQVVSDSEAEVSDEAEVSVEREADIQTGGVSVEVEKDEEVDPEES